jgi:ABC-type multidrug transport system fused ATPase/permease subunit
MVPQRAEAKRMSGSPKTLRQSRSAIHFLAPYARPHRRHLVSGGLLTLVLVAARLAFPWPLRGLMEIVFHGNAPGRATGVVDLVPQAGSPEMWLIGVFVVIILVWGVAESFQRLAFTRFGVGLANDLRRKAIRRVSADSSGTSPGELIATITGDISKVKSGVTSILIGLTRNGVFFLGVAVIVTLIDPVIGLVFLGGGLATVVASAVGAARSSPISKRSRRRAEALTEDLHRHLTGEVQLAKPPRHREKPDSKTTRVEGITTFVVHAILAAATCAILLLTIDAGQSGRLSPGAVFTVLAYILLMHNKTVGIGRSIVRAGRILPSVGRIAALVKRKPHPPGGPDERPSPPPSPTYPAPTPAADQPDADSEDPSPGHLPILGRSRAP